MRRFLFRKKSGLIFFALLVILRGGIGIEAQVEAQSLRDSSGGAAQGGAFMKDSAARGVPLPVKRIVIFSSGLAYYEHSGTLNGASVFSLPFKTGAVNDALKSLVINDPASANPSVNYQSEQTLLQTLRSLSIDLSGYPGMAEILSGLRGAEVEIASPTAISGRIVGIEYRVSHNPVTGETNEPWLSLYTAQGLKLYNLKEISAINFKDPTLNADLNRALNLIAASRQSDTRDLDIRLPGADSRQVSLSYVIPSPVWKVSYRLDLGGAGNADGAKPLFQGWAIVDNDSDTDWNRVTLSLVAGRPASFIQNLYPPYYLSRPVLPLAIAGTAAAETHDTAYAAEPIAPRAMAKSGITARVREEFVEESVMEMEADYMAAAPSVAGGVMQTARGSAAGDQFEFTVKNPVSLDRRMSAMLPLVEANIEARKVLIFSGTNPAGVSLNPRLGAEITNTSQMKLPAGPITVYDGGTYAGDALIEFWNENEKRLISFGEDLSVTGVISNTSARAVSAVTVSGSVMTISRRQDIFRTYTFKNTARYSKSLVVEHPKTYGAVLESPEADEQTPQAYRFTMTLPAERELIVTIRESQPLSERISLLTLRPEAFLSYVSNQEIPRNVRDALERAMELKRAVDNAQMNETDIQNRRNNLISEQDRIRKNLEAAGGQTQQGQEYLKRLVALDAAIDAQNAAFDNAQIATKTARQAYENYLNELNL